MSEVLLIIAVFLAAVITWAPKYAVSLDWKMLALYVFIAFIVGRFSKYFVD